MNETNYKQRLASLNSSQLEAVHNTEGPVLVIAGPGTGKTELLAIRTAYILEEGLASASSILLLTFTDSGANNMRERLYKLIGPTAHKISIFTFHSFASYIMSKYSEHFFNDLNYTPLAEIEKYKVLENILSKLDRDDILSSYHIDHGYTYINDIINMIAELKKGDLSPSQFKTIIDDMKVEFDYINRESDAVLQTMSRVRDFDKILNGYLNLLQVFNNGSGNYNKFLYNTLSIIIQNTTLKEDKQGLIDFRDEFYTKDDNNKFILKDSSIDKINKWYSLVNVYEKYNQALNENLKYDFEDMIYNLSSALKRRDSLLFDLGEKYQYIMVDEYQDTNAAQLSIIQSLTSISEDAPNILVVGDDNQAIFKFQGAELDNIFSFIKHYKNVKKIVLTNNYRSTQNILDYSRSLTFNIQDTLEKRDASINKELKSSNTKINNEGGIHEIQFESHDNQYDYIAKSVSELIKSNVDPSEISIISKKHESLKNISKYFKLYNIPFTYEKEESVFDLPHIRELINILLYLDGRNDLLPEILSYEFFNINKIDIYKLLIDNKSKVNIDNDGVTTYIKNDLLLRMQNSENVRIKQLANFLISLKVKSIHTPLLNILDLIIGNTTANVDLEDEDNIKESDNYISPYKGYYFSTSRFNENFEEYFNDLLALGTFVNSLREWKGESMVYVKDIKGYIELYENNNLNLNIRHDLYNEGNSVILQTAYKSKGLEYEYVFIIDADKDNWEGRGRVKRISSPKHLALSNNPDLADDKLRLLYVAKTRAKHTLYISYTKEKTSLLDNINYDNINISKIEKYVNNKIANKYESFAFDNLDLTLQNLLKDIVKDYKMPVTHLINYLNISKAGPDKFVTLNLLRFPQAITPSGAYGSAMHKTVENYYRYYKANDKAPSRDLYLSWLKNSLSSGDLEEHDINKYFKSGSKSLELYFNNLHKREDGLRFNKDTIVELDLKHEGISYNEALLTGKLDKVTIEQDKLIISDLKTGSSDFINKKSKTPYEKIKLHFYEYQLAYYKILLENSNSYNHYNIESAYIEFIEPDEEEIITYELDFKSEYGMSIYNRVKLLTTKVYKMIQDLKFPNINEYIYDENGKEKEVKLDDIIEFEDRLLNNYYD